MHGRGRRENGQAEGRAADPLDAGRQDAAFETQRDGGKRRSRHPGAPEERHGDPSFIFWSASIVKCAPPRRTAMARLAATAPFGINSPPPPRKRVIMRSTSGLLAAR